MKSIAAPAYTRTTSVELAAALSVIGVQVKPDLSEDRVSGKRWESLLISLDTLPDPQGEQLPSHQTKLVMSMVQTGQLQDADPHHPVLDALRACKAADTLIEWTRKAKPHRQLKVKGAQRWLLAEGQLPPSISTLPGLLGTRDIKLAASLLVLGFQLLRLEGSAPEVLFVFGQALFLPSECPQVLRTAYRNGSLAVNTPEHPLLWMMQALSNREAIRDMLRNRQPLILIRAPNTGRASLVSSNAKGKTMDRVKRHLQIP